MSDEYASIVCLGCNGVSIKREVIDALLEQNKKLKQELVEAENNEAKWAVKATHALESVRIAYEELEDIVKDKEHDSHCECSSCETLAVLKERHEDISK